VLCYLVYVKGIVICRVGPYLILPLAFLFPPGSYLCPICWVKICLLVRNMGKGKAVGIWHGTNFPVGFMVVLRSNLVTGTNCMIG
jgi:hypothetical protein